MAFDGGSGTTKLGFEGVSVMKKPVTYQKGMEADTRWGHWIVTDDVVFDSVTGKPIRCQKDITVNAGASLSAQVHWGRGEHYTGIEGETHVYVNGHVFKIKKDESVVVPRGSIHFSWNETNSPSKFHEIQQGPLCDEDDIMRCADKYKKPSEMNSDKEVVSLLLKVARERYDTEPGDSEYVAQDYMNSVKNFAREHECTPNPFANETFVDELRLYFENLIKSCKSDHQSLTPALSEIRQEQNCKAV